jgi:hypothetical protein
MIFHPPGWKKGDPEYIAKFDPKKLKKGEAVPFEGTLDTSVTGAWTVITVGVFEENNTRTTVQAQLNVSVPIPK